MCFLMFYLSPMISALVLVAACRSRLLLRGGGAVRLVLILDRVKPFGQTR